MVFCRASMSPSQSRGGAMLRFGLLIIAGLLFFATPALAQGSQTVTVERGGRDYLAGVRAGLPFALVVGVVAFSFGALARSLGWGVIAPIAFSVTTFSVAAQFAVAAVLGAGGGAFTAIAAAVLLNARFLPMGMAVAPFLKGGPLRRALEGQTILTTSWALASRGGGRFDRAFMIGATVPQYVAWTVGTAVGVLSHVVVGDVERLGLDVVFPAFFLAVL